MLTCSGFGPSAARTSVRVCTRRGRLVDKRRNETGMMKWAREHTDREILCVLLIMKRVVNIGGVMC